MNVNNNLLFDIVTNNQTSDISYNSATGEFTFTTEGTYFVSWWVATDGSGTDTDVHFTLRLNGVSETAGASPIVQGQVNGSGIIVVQSTPSILSLYNSSSDVVNIAATPVQANLVILEVAF